MTAWGSVDVAVEAMRRGARDFVQKPWENARLLATLRTQAELARALRRGQRLEAENRALRDEGRPLLIAESEAMRPVLEMIERVGPSDANVLITGENGTGKGTVAAALHAVSARAAKPLLTVNAGGLSEGVFESELFGHVKGAFTDAKADRVGRFEMADGGTLFLDEIANVPLNLQPKLLRVLETGEFERVGSSRTRRADVRVLSATNADLRQEVANGRFRQDLLFRLNTIEIQVPPLRERREDIPLLAGHFLRAARPALPQGPSRGFDADAMRALAAHPWPGNVRELDHAVERAVLMARGDEIREADLGLKPARAARRPRPLDEMSLEEVEALPRSRRRCSGTAATSAARPRRSASRAAPSTAASSGTGSSSEAGDGLRAAPPRRRFPHDRRVLLLALGAGLPALAARRLSSSLRSDLAARTQWTLVVLVVLAWLAFASLRAGGGDAPAADAVEPARRAARGGLLVPGAGRAPRRSARAGALRGERARADAARAAARRARGHRAAAQGDGGDRRGGLRLRRGVDRCSS